MSFRGYLVLMGLSTVIAWLGWVIVLFNIDPFASGAVGFVLFYITLWAGLIGTLTIAGLLYRVYALRRGDLVIREVRVSFRHALLLSLVSIIALILSAQGWFSWWVLVVLIVVAGVIEYISLVVQQSRRG